MYAEEISKATPEYEFLPISATHKENNYTEVWYEAFNDKNAVYLKMDDDVVFAEDNAIPRLVTTLIKNPNALLVSSLVVNNPALGWLAYRMGALHPYMPEFQPPLARHLASRENGIWRPSELPKRVVPPEEGVAIDSYHYMFGAEEEKDIPKHRWVPVSENYLPKTPAAFSEYDPFGANLHFWPLAAQAHYSLLHNIEENTLDRYFMVHNTKNPADAQSTWRMTGTRLSINFIAIRGRDVLENLEDIVASDDEHALTVDIPASIDRCKFFPSFFFVFVLTNTWHQRFLSRRPPLLRTTASDLKRPSPRRTFWNGITTTLRNEPVHRRLSSRKSIGMPRTQRIGRGPKSNQHKAPRQTRRMKKNRS